MKIKKIMLTKISKKYLILLNLIILVLGLFVGEKYWKDFSQIIDYFL